MKDLVIQEYRDEVVNILNSLHIAHNDKHYMLKLRDMIFSLTSLYHIFEEYLANKELEHNHLREPLKDFFKKRWQIIHDSPLADNTEWYLNTLCSTIAEYVDPANYKKMMHPALQVEQDAYYNDFNKIEIHQRIFSDDNKSFIMIEDVLTQAITRLNNREPQIFAYINANHVACALTQSEIEKITAIYPDFKKLVTLANQVSNGTLYQQLLDLRQGLLVGDVHHEGTELDAGIVANVAIAKFFEYYNTLSSEFKQYLSALTHTYNHQTETLGEILDGLACPTGHLAISDCISLRGNRLASFLSQRQADLELKVNLEAFQALLAQFKRIVNDIIAQSKQLMPFESHKEYQGFSTNASLVAIVLSKYLLPQTRLNLAEEHFKNLLEFLIIQLDCACVRIQKYEEADAKKYSAITQQHQALFDIVIALARLARDFPSYKPEKQEAYLKEMHDRLAMIEKITNGSKNFRTNYEKFKQKENFFLKRLLLKNPKEPFNHYYDQMHHSSRRILIIDEKFMSNAFVIENYRLPTFFAPIPMPVNNNNKNTKQIPITQRGRANTISMGSATHATVQQTGVTSIKLAASQPPRSSLQAPIHPTRKEEEEIKQPHPITLRSQVSTACLNNTAQASVQQNGIASTKPVTTEVPPRFTRTSIQLPITQDAIKQHPIIQRNRASTIALGNTTQSTHQPPIVNHKSPFSTALQSASPVPGQLPNHKDNNNLNPVCNRTRPTTISSSSTTPSPVQPNGVTSLRPSSNEVPSNSSSVTMQTTTGSNWRQHRKCTIPPNQMPTYKGPSGNVSHVPLNLQPSSPLFWQSPSAPKTNAKTDSFISNPFLSLNPK